MIGFAARTSIGAYVCPRGVFVVECRRTRTGIQIDRTFDVAARLDSAAEAAEDLVRVLRSAHIESADVFVALRGFDLGHHILQLPAARHDVLSPIVDRELRRLDPDVVTPMTAWTPLSASPLAESVDTRSAQLAATIPAEVVTTFAARLRSEGHALAHLTALPAAILRIAEEFDAGSDVSAIVAALPDGVYLAFLLAGALRVVVEPSAHADAPQTGAALAEEAELGAVLVRQQFHGAELDRLTIVGAVDAADDAESALAERLGVPVKRFALRDLSAAAHVAVGAVLDAGSAAPLSLGGSTREYAQRRGGHRLRSASLVAAVVAIVLAAWTAYGVLDARRAASDLAVAQRRVQQDSFGVASIRKTAAQRKLMRDAQVALHSVAADRTQLQRIIVNMATALNERIRVDSIGLNRTLQGWTVAVDGTASGETSARAVQTLHDFYQELPRRMTVNDLSLERLAYVDSATVGSAVRFALTFAVSARAGGKD